MSQTNLEQEIGYLKALARDVDRPLDKGAYKTYNRKSLHHILMQTGGQVSTIIGGKVYQYKIVHKHIGVGVYHVWLERILEQ